VDSSPEGELVLKKEKKLGVMGRKKSAPTLGTWWKQKNRIRKTVSWKKQITKSVGGSKEENFVSSRPEVGRSPQVALTPRACQHRKRNGE